jgi:hypothetical protein
MNESQRLQYLDAMGIEVWISKQQAAARAVQAAIAEVAESPQPVPSNRKPQTHSTPIHDLVFDIGPGSGQTLLLCGQREEASSQLASDIARCLDEAPVWGWQAQSKPSMVAAATGSGAAGLSLDCAIKERLFTRVLVFAAGSAAKQGSSEVLGSARVIYAPPLNVLAKSPEHKRSLWQQLVGNGWCSRQK